MNHHVVIKKQINASPERIFEAWTNPLVMQDWFKPNSEWQAITINVFKVGGMFHHEMIDKMGKIYLHVGEYKEINQPLLLSFTWNSAAVNKTLVTIELTEFSDSTQVTLTHSFISDAQQEKNHLTAWTESLNNLANYLQDPF